MEKQRDKIAKRIERKTQRANGGPIDDMGEPVGDLSEPQDGEQDGVEADGVAADAVDRQADA